MLTREEVMERIQKLDALIARERELKEFLLNLKVIGRQDEVATKKQQHDEAIEEIQRNRMEQMVPIVKELHAFTQEGKAWLRAKAK